MNLKDLLEMIVEDIGEVEVEEELRRDVGTVKPETLKKFMKHREAKIDFKDEFELRQMQLEKRMKRQLSEEFEDRVEALEKGHVELWNEIYTELGLDPEENYNMKGDTGLVQQIIKSKKFRLQ